jgi:hypothetical protein
MPGIIQAVQCTPKREENKEEFLGGFSLRLSGFARDAFFL